MARVTEVDSGGADLALAPEAGNERGSDGPDDAGRQRTGPGRRSRWRERRMVVPAAVAVVSLSIAGVLAFPRSGGDDGAGTGRPSSAPSTTLDTGGIDVPAPDGWLAAPVPRLGFGIAVPPGWEAAVLSDEMLNSLSRAEPRVTGFVEAAHAAAQDGAVFYAAGEDGRGRVTDLKLRAATGTGIRDVAGLEDYARGLISRSGVRDATVEPVGDAGRPTVHVRFQTVAASPDGDRVTAFGIETDVVGPDDVVWSLIITSEDAAMLDDLAPRIFGTLTLQPRADR